MKAYCATIYKKLFCKDYINELLFALYHYEPATYCHCCRTAKLALQLAHGDVNANELEVLSEAALLHDIGKLMIDRDVLNKPGKLTPSEYGIIQQHARYGEAIVRTFGVHEKVAYLIANHHPENNNVHPENSDPLLEILIKADNIDAWMCKRPYKSPFSKQQVIELLYSKFTDGLSNQKALHILYQGANFQAW